MKNFILCFGFVTSMIACGPKSSGVHEKIDQSSPIDLGRSMPTLPSVEGAAYLRNNPDSLIECRHTELGDASCKMIAKSIVLSPNPDKLDRTFKVSYKNTCTIPGVPADTIDSGITVSAQPAEEGAVVGKIFRNRSDSFTIRGTGDLRVEYPRDYELAPLFEKGCSLVVNFELVN